MFSEFVKPFSYMRCALLVGGTAVADNEADFLAHGAQVRDCASSSAVN